MFDDIKVCKRESFGEGVTSLFNHKKYDTVLNYFLPKIINTKGKLELEC